VSLTTKPASSATIAEIQQRDDQPGVVTGLDERAV